MTVCTARYRNPATRGARERVRPLVDHDDHELRRCRSQFACLANSTVRRLLLSPSVCMINPPCLRAPTTRSLCPPLYSSAYLPGSRDPLFVQFHPEGNFLAPADFPLVLALSLTCPLSPRRNQEREDAVAGLKRRSRAIDLEKMSSIRVRAGGSPSPIVCAATCPLASAYLARSTLRINLDLVCIVFARGECNSADSQGALARHKIPSAS